MEVHFTEAVKTQLEELAAANGKNPEELVQETIERMLSDRATFLASVQEGIHQADRGELIERHRGRGPD